jgi:hypothetical protein
VFEKVSEFKVVAESEEPKEAKPRKFHEKGCTCGYLNPVVEWAGGSYVVIVAFECPECKKRTPASEFFPKVAG